MRAGISIERVREICPMISKNDFASKKIICEFNRINDNKEVRRIQATVKNHGLIQYDKENIKHLWAFYGHVMEDKYICIEVGSSENILNEISGIIKLMYEPKCNIEKKSAFHNETIYISEGYCDKTCYKYRYINQLFDGFIFTELDVEGLQEGNNSRYYDTNYAEVMYAYQTKALVWNPAPKTMDSSGHMNQEKDILKELLEKESRYPVN